MSTANPGLYIGRVKHHRLRPRQHKFTYDAFWIWLDLGQMQPLSNQLRWFSYNKFNFFGFYDRDHGDGSNIPLRIQINQQLAAAGIDLGGGKIFLLTMPRVLGYVFNPLSIYFCYSQSGILTAILWEVTNTFGQRHSYLIPVDPRDTKLIRQSCEKCFYVSPFLDLDMTYTFRLHHPSESLSIAMTGCDQKGPVIVAALNGGRMELTDVALARVFLNLPFLTLKVMGAIHWEALRIWLKGIKLRIRPPPPEQSVTLVQPLQHLHTDEAAVHVCK